MMKAVGRDLGAGASVTKLAAHGLVLASPWAFAQCQPIPDEAPVDLLLERGGRRSLRPTQWQVNDPSHLSVASDPAGVYLFSYCGSRAFLPYHLERPAARAQVWRGAAISRERFEHTVLHAFLPNLIAVLGHVVLHAASVVIAGRAWLFAGESGIGKSTLAAGFARLGRPVLAEDIVRLDWQDGRAVTFPSYRTARLRPSSFLLPSDLRRARAGRFGLPKHQIPLAPLDPMQPVPLGGLLLLGRSRQTLPTIEPLMPVAALPSVLGVSFLQGLPPAVRSREAIERAARILRTIPVFRLRYRRSAGHFPDLLDRLCEALPPLAMPLPTASPALHR